jgi:diguanylate cyclase (GGDEF)-like protein
MDMFINPPAPSHEKFCLFYIYLFVFKNLNDSLGHETGDKILAQVAKRIRDVTRKQDVLARIGGDEFALLVNQGDSPEVLESIGQRILEAISQAYYCKESLISLSASIGIASFPCHGTTREEIVNSADKAMYLAKERGPGKICSFQIA